MASDRRDFLKGLTVAGVALSALPATLSANESPAASLQYNEWDDQPPAAPQFDTSWTEKLTGKYKTVFDVPAIEGGAGVWRAGMWVDHYKDVLKAQPSDLSPVVVIRHAGIPLIMNHEFWEKYDIAKASKVRHPMTDKKTTRNPILMTVEDDKLSARLAGYTLNKQIERGVVVLACNLAFGGMVATLAKKEKLNMAEARKQAMAMMVPGVILQPNGIFGVALAQHHGCGFVAAT
jgi:hypothetical protein